MATDLTGIFGSEITVFANNRQVDKQHSGNAGSNSLTSMHLGGRGYDFVVRGTLRAAGNTYDTARAALVDILDNTIEPLLWAEVDDYEFRGETFSYIDWLKIDLIPDGQGVVYHYTGADMLVNFIAFGRSLE